MNEAIDKEKLMLDSFAGPVNSVEDLQSVYGRLSAEDQAKLVESLNVLRGRSLKSENGRKSIDGGFGASAEISSEGIQLEISLIPGILKIKISQKDIENLWHWLSGNGR